MKKNEWICQRRPEKNEYPFENKADGVSGIGVHGINYKWIHKAALQCRSAYGILVTSQSGNDVRQDEPQYN
jgi:hypothetical protein